MDQAPDDDRRRDKPFAGRSRRRRPAPEGACANGPQVDLRSGPYLRRTRTRVGPGSIPSRIDDAVADGGRSSNRRRRGSLFDVDSSRPDAGTAERVSPAPAEQRQILHFRQLFGPIRLDSRRRAAISHASRRWGHLPRRIVFACRSAFGPRGLAGTTKLLSDLKPLSD